MSGTYGIVVNGRPFADRWRYPGPLGAAMRMLDDLGVYRCQACGQHHVGPEVCGPCACDHPQAEQVRVPAGLVAAVAFAGTETEQTRPLTEDEARAFLTGYEMGGDHR